MTDNFYRAKDQINAETDREKEIAAVYETIGQKLQDVFAELGVVETNPVGEDFDPMLHENRPHDAVRVRGGKVAQVMQPGFAVGNRVVRPAYVAVSGGPRDPSSQWNPHTGLFREPQRTWARARACLARRREHPRTPAPIRGGLAADGHLLLPLLFAFLPFRWKPIPRPDLDASLPLTPEPLLEPRGLESRLIAPRPPRRETGLVAARAPPATTLCCESSPSK